LHRQAVVAALKETAVPARTGVLVSVALAAACGVYWIARCLASGRLPLHAPAELPVFVENYWHLLSGATIYEYISGAGAPGAVEWSVYTVAAINWSFAALAVVSLAGVWRRLCDVPSRVDVILITGWLTMLAGFFLVAGPGAIAPHFERYGICLVAPAALVLARGLVWWLDHAQRFRRAVVIVLAMAAWIWPLSFYLNYINYFEKTGGTSHATFRTAAEEPKQLALDFILEQRQPSSPVRIVCSQWWNYWPLAYLAFDKPDVEVLDWSRWQRIAAAEGARAVESAWFVEFADKTLQEGQLRSYEAESLIFPRKEITDYSGGRVITVFGPREKFSQDY
jgi:hypothetical protein